MSIGSSTSKDGAYESLGIIAEGLRDGSLDAEGCRPLLSKTTPPFDFEAIKGGPDAKKRAVIVCDALRKAIRSDVLDFDTIIDFLQEHRHAPLKERRVYKVRAKEIEDALKGRTSIGSLSDEFPDVNFEDERNKDAILAACRQARRDELRKLGVLDGEGNAVPGQEIFVELGDYNWTIG